MKMDSAVPLSAEAASGHLRFALSTNWNNAGRTDGAEIADEAIALGFDALELGFRTLPEQLPGIKSRLDRITVDSVHAYCPVPPGAPSGHPELHQLLSKDKEERAFAAFLLRKTFECAEDMGAKVVVFHAGYVDLVTFFSSYGAFALKSALEKAGGKVDDPSYAKRVAKARRLRAKRGAKLVEVFKSEFAKLVPDLEKRHLVLALENLPRIEGFPNPDEAERLMDEFKGGPLRLWFDTGHARVCACNRWLPHETEVALRLSPHSAGMHLNDVKDFNDDHRQPGWGKVDFAALKPFASRPDVLRVFEPHKPVTAAELGASLSFIRSIW